MIRILILALALFAGPAWGQTVTLTPAQMATLRADVIANPDTLALYNAGDRAGLAAAYNAASSPTCVVWRTQVTQHEYTTQVGPTGTEFDWASTGGYIARSQGERDAWSAIFNSSGAVNPSRANVRAAFANIFSGTGAGAVANRAHLTAVSKRTATRLEKLFASGACTDASPSVMTVEGSVSEQLFIDI